MPSEALKVFSGGANQVLAQEICAYLDLPLSRTDIRRFPDGEIWVKLMENVRGMDVFLIQPTCHPVNESLMELLLLIDALKRSSAKRITAVMPYYGYARQDRKDQPRVALSAKLVANLITTAGADRVLTMDLHAPQIQGFFDIPVDHLIAEPLLVKYFSQKSFTNLVVASTDVGGVKMARSFAEHLGASLAVVDKRRSGPEEVKAMTLIGEVEGCDVLIPDDIIATAGTLCEAASFLKQRGAKRIFGCCTHPVFRGPALERVERAPIEEIVVTNTIPTKHLASLKKLEVLSVAPLFGEAIRSIHNETSVTRLFRVNLDDEKERAQPWLKIREEAKT